MVLPFASATTNSALRNDSEFVWLKVDHDFNNDETVFRDLFFINATHGWIVGQNMTGLGYGIILHTVDGGMSWSLQLYNESQWFFDIDIVEQNVIWVTGLGGLLYSTDWGQNWIEESIVDERSGLSFIEFANVTHGWTATMNTLYATRDGGATWDTVAGWNFDDVPRMMHCATPTEMWAIGFFGIYYSHDGGETWQQKHEEGGSAMSFVSESEAWAVGDRMLAHMTDGNSWMDQALPRPYLFPPQQAPIFGDIIFIDKNQGWIVGKESSVVFTPNGGLDWYSQAVYEGLDKAMFAVDFINRTHGWAAGTGGTILLTTRGDNIGTRLWTGLTDRLFLTFVIGSVLIAVSIGGILIIWNRKRQGIIDEGPRLE